jgi:hypothetical protein
MNLTKKSKLTDVFRYKVTIQDIYLVCVSTCSDCGYYSALGTDLVKNRSSNSLEFEFELTATPRNSPSLCSFAWRKSHLSRHSN